MPIFIQCPNPACGKSANTPEEYVGHFVRCRYCQQRFKVTPPSQATQPPAAARTAAESANETAAPDAAAARRTSSPAALPPGTLTPGGDRPTKIGRFELCARLGAGAFGTVYRAFDPQLEREVALKVPQPGTLENPTAKERFLREAKASARLRHPHIVPIHDAGHDGQVYYIASAFIEGQTLADPFGDKGMEFRQAARIVRDLAEALAYAHGKGIVHRDVKPANVMVDTEGEAHLMDFGIAHLEETAEKLTRGEGGPGTPSYMAPEQSQGKPVPASDQYSLGAMLYELLCGQTPFSSPPSLQIFHHLNTEPPSPRKYNPGVPLDLQTICLKALNKQPNERYAGCQEMANDLRRWLEGDVIRARRVGMGERVVRWCRRKPVMAALILALLVGTVISSGIAYVAVVMTIRAERGDESERRQRGFSYIARMQEIQHAWNEGNTHRVYKLLKEDQGPDAGQDDLRGFEWYYFWKLYHSDRFTLRGHTAGVTSVAFSPDGQRIASASDDKTVKLWDAVAGRELLSLMGHTERVINVTFSPDGQGVISGDAAGMVKLWDVATGREILHRASSPPDHEPNL